MECITCKNQLVEGAAFCPECGTRQPGTPSYDVRDYAAFISYRHRSPDDDIARRLHRAIESYRLPRAIARSYGAPRLGRVFRDRDELPATGSLPDAIRDALERSGALVVVCSPETPGSKWVEQEIELFASMHGRDRIFAALAEGATSESLPEALKTRVLLDTAGEPRRIPAEPLAADMRASSASAFNQEKLRILAGIAGCSYDDLRQRERSRRMIRVAASLAALVCIACAIGIFALQAAESRENERIAESERLAVVSREELSHGNRYEAIETALEAVSLLDSSNPSPALETATSALREALGLEENDTEPWHAAYSITTEHPISAIGNTGMARHGNKTPTTVGNIVLCETESYIALSDDAGAIFTYDLSTGKRLAEIELQENADDNGVYVTFACAGDKVAVNRGGKARSFSGYNARTSEVAWQYSDVSFSTLAPSFDQSVLDIASVTDDGKLIAGMFDVEEGELASLSEITLPRVPDLRKGVEGAMGARMADLFVAADTMLVKTEAGEEMLAESGSLSTTLAFPDIASLSYQDGLVIAATVEHYDERDGLALSYAIEAFDDGLERKWTCNGEVSSEMMVNGDLSTIVLGWPAVRGYMTTGTAADDGDGTNGSSDNAARTDGAHGSGIVIVTVGRSMLALSAESGEELFRQDFSSTVVGAKPVWLLEGTMPQVAVACADGSIALCNLEARVGNTSADQYRFNLGERIRWASFGDDGDHFILLAASAESNDRLIAYQMDLSEDPGSEEESGREYSLDELVELGREALSQR